ncbi:uncharacterized protein LOC129137988 [Pan troglodytes]|uniref:uncharacterized protein LOC129137988 n=1 Tax=Pan troglodytes TaxID=9598 RepID=UPI003013E73F
MTLRSYSQKAKIALYIIKRTQTKQSAQQQFRVFTSFFEHINQKLPEPPPLTKNLFAQLAENIASSLGISSCYVWFLQTLQGGKECGVGATSARLRPTTGEHVLSATAQLPLVDEKDDRQRRRGQAAARPGGCEASQGKLSRQLLPRPLWEEGRGRRLQGQWGGAGFPWVGAAASWAPLTLWVRVPLQADLRGNSPTPALDPPAPLNPLTWEPRNLGLRSPATLKPHPIDHLLKILVPGSGLLSTVNTHIKAPGSLLRRQSCLPPSDFKAGKCTDLGNSKRKYFLSLSRHQVIPSLCLGLVQPSKLCVASMLWSILHISTHFILMTIPLSMHDRQLHSTNEETGTVKTKE